ncbi:MAG TPA: aminotransferase class V-fold PLP-dependent enzyme, partial [Acidimicrobiales bacterium]|nr:aminotransferase class V-fold PLP-dependent enzyme [Acidimicrobiales bacterium]
MTTYLDHAATTPVRPEAVEAMLPHLGGSFGNPSGAHSVARRARNALDEARETMAEALGCEPGEVVFTSGGTEADNLAVLGVHDRCGGRVLTSAIEHP